MSWRDRIGGWHRTFQEAWRADLVGAVMAMLFMLPMILSCGAVVYQPLGSAFVPIGMSAAFATALAGALVLAVVGRGRLHINAPRATQAALLATMMAGVSTLPELTSALSADPAARAVTLMTVVAAALVVAGLTQVVLGALRLGDLVKYVPQTIVAGFVTGFVIQIVLIQVPFLLGLTGWPEVWRAVAGTGDITLPALGFGGLAGVATLVLPRFIPVVPGALMGLIVGSVAQYGAGWWVDDPHRLGPLIGALPSGLPVMPPIAGLEFATDPHLLAALVYPVVATGITLAFISSVQSLLSAAMADSLLKTRYNSNRELINQGLCNILSGFIGGTSTGGSPLLTRSAYNHGSRTWRTNLCLAICLVVMTLVLVNLVGAIPLSVMAAVVVIQMVQGLDEWSRHLVVKVVRRPGRAFGGDLALDFVVLILVSALVAFVDVLAAVGIGMLATVAVFLKRSSGSAIRRVYRGDTFQSHTARSNVDADRLECHGQVIAVVELQGPVFFGSADLLSRRIETEAATTAVMILDFRRVTDIDSTGALILDRVDQALAERGCRLLLAGLPEDSDSRRFIREVGYDAPEREGRVIAEMDTALAYAEDLLLATLNEPEAEDTEIPLAEHPSLAGLGEAHLSVLQVIARREDYAPGHYILRNGDPADAVLLLVKGRATRQLRPTSDQRPVRQAGYRPGVLLGETALLRGGVWTAEVVADTPTVCYRLALDDLLMMDRISPRIAVTILRNIGDSLMIRNDQLRLAQWAQDQ
jgi:MFS superfamily sulfate permease-like transporter